ncbi:MAG: hypothetical protein AAGM22_11030 [Acidobacteriota bacterium]
MRMLTQFPCRTQMKTTWLRFGLVALVVLSGWGLSPGTAEAQEPAFNATEISTWDDPGQEFADVWGAGNFAYLAQNGQRTVTIVDITDPAAPVFASRYDAVTFASAQDVKVHDGLLFVGLEQSSAGVHVVDVRYPYAPVKLTDVTVLGSVHNVFYDEGWLYIVDSDTTQIAIVDLRAYDPDNPPAAINTPTWRIQNVGNLFVHDITVANGRLYASAWDSLRIYDVSNIANEEPPLLGFVHGENAHAAWPTADGQFVVVAEERGSGGIALYEVIESGADEVTIEVRDYYIVQPEFASSSHNPLIVGNRVYVSYYASGIQVLEIDPVTKTFFLVASFDTTPSDGSDGTFAGCWGVYPFLGEDLVLASDRSLGLNVIDVQPNVLRFHETATVPMTVPSAGGQVTVDLQAVGSAIQGGSVGAQASLDGGAPVAVPMTLQGGRTFAGTLPPASCGSFYTVSFEADNQLGTTFTDPPDGSQYLIGVADSPTVLFEDDFSLDLGWTVDNTNLTSGAWERGDPVGTGNQTEFDATGDVNGSCYFTGNTAPAGGVGTNDVDGGPTVLTSPVIDHSAGAGIVSYRYWISDSNGIDALIVEVSADGTNWVEARRYAGDLREWNRDAFRLEDFIAPSATTQIRFSISDEPDFSLVEAAVDSVSVVALGCSAEIFSDDFESGDTSEWSVSFP